MSFNDFLDDVYDEGFCVGYSGGSDETCRHLDGSIEWDHWHSGFESGNNAYEEDERVSCLNEADRQNIY